MKLGRKPQYKPNQRRSPIRTDDDEFVPKWRKNMPKKHHKDGSGNWQPWESPTPTRDPKMTNRMSHELRRAQRELERTRNGKQRPDRKAE